MRLRLLLLTIPLLAVGCPADKSLPPAELGPAVKSGIQGALGETTPSPTPAAGDMSCTTPECHDACAKVAAELRADCPAAFVAGCFTDNPPIDGRCARLAPDSPGARDTPPSSMKRSASPEEERARPETADGDSVEAKATPIGD